MLLYEFDKIDKIWESMEEWKSVSSIDDDYLETATAGVLAVVIFTGKHLCWNPF